MGSQPGSAPELNLSSAGTLQFFHSLGKCSLTVTQGPGVRPAQVTAYRLSTRRIQGLLPEEPQTLCQERVCTRGRVITTISRSSWVDGQPMPLKEQLGGQPMPCMLSQASIHSSRSRPLPKVQTGEGGPGLPESRGRIHAYRNPGPHTICGNLSP